MYHENIKHSDTHKNCCNYPKMSRLMTKPTKWVHPVKTQISLGICPVWSELLLCAQWVAKDPRFLHADSEDSDQTGWMHRLIWVFAGRTLILLVLTCRGSNLNASNGCRWNGKQCRPWSGPTLFYQTCLHENLDLLTSTAHIFGCGKGANPLAFQKQVFPCQSCIFSSETD